MRSLISMPLSTIVPPSPFSLRLMASHAYSTLTRIMRAHVTSDRTHITLSGVGLRRRNIYGKGVNGAGADVAKNKT